MRQAPQKEEEASSAVKAHQDLTSCDLSYLEPAEGLHALTQWSSSGK